MYYPPEQFSHLIGRADSGGWSASTDKDNFGYMVYGPYTTAPLGHRIAYFQLVIDNNTAYDHVVAVLEVADDNNQRIGARALRRRDFVKSNVPQIFGIPFYNKGNKRIQFRILWHKTAYLRFSGVWVLPCPMDWDLEFPILGSPNEPNQWYPLRAPQAVYPVWLDPTLASIPDNTGRSLYERHQQVFHNIGRVCGLAFRQVPHANAAMRFYYGTPSQVESLSIQFGNSKEWFGTNEYGSVYLAVHPDRRHVWTGSQTKPAQGGHRIGRINAIRFPQHALWTAWGWNYHDHYSPMHAARNANMSADFRYPTTGPNTSTYGLAGFDWHEINWLRKHWGYSWLGIYEAGL